MGQNLSGHSLPETKSHLRQVTVLCILPARTSPHISEMAFHLLITDWAAQNRMQAVKQKHCGSYNIWQFLEEADNTNSPAPQSPSGGTGKTLDQQTQSGLRTEPMVSESALITFCCIVISDICSHFCACNELNCYPDLNLIQSWGYPDPDGVALLLSAFTPLRSAITLR